MTPLRIQRRRLRGWRMPPNTIYVGRPTIWSNWFVELNGVVWLSDGRGEGIAYIARPEGDAPYNPAALFMAWIDERTTIMLPAKHEALVEQKRRTILARIEELRGNNLACWCPPDRPCHADVLLEIANR